MRRPLVAGNWKMNGSTTAARTLLDGIVGPVGGLRAAEVAVCPPFVFLRDAATQLAGSSVALGAQSLCEHESGAYTGEVSGAMLRDLGCSYVIVGHSERRQYFGETNALVARKFARALATDLVPILCVGETLAEREAGQTEAVVTRQLAAVVEGSGIGAFAGAVIAYEPVWAIGTGRTATPQQAQAVHACIRGWLAAASATVAAGIRLLYGGSVKGANAAELFAEPDIDGGLIGGASLNAGEFMTICQAADGRKG
jgi:triosephosphate isomerase